ncbi:MAG: porin [Gallionella sp.]
MNKKLMTIAVAAVLAPAAAFAENANIEFYGRIHASLDSVSGNGATAGASAKNTVSLNDNSSRFGLKGKHDMGNGLTGVFQAEAALDANGKGGAGALPGLRDTYIGLAGGFGTVLVGKLPAANQYVYDSNLFADQLGDAANFTGNSMPGRANGALHYVAPKFSDVTVALTYLPASSLESTLGGYAAAPATDKADNSAGFTAGYAANGITAKLAYFSIGLGNQAAAGYVNGKLQPLSIAGSYDFGNGMVSAQFVSIKLTNAGATNTRNIYNIGGKFNVTETGAIKAQFSKAGTGAAGALDGAQMFAVGYDHTLSKQMSMYVVYAQTTNDTNGAFVMDNWGHNSQSAGMLKGNDPKGLGVGLTYNF